MRLKERATVLRQGQFATFNLSRRDPEARRESLLLIADEAAANEDKELSVLCVERLLQDARLQDSRMVEVSPNAAFKVYTPISTSPFDEADIKGDYIERISEDPFEMLLLALPRDRIEGIIQRIINHLDDRDAAKVDLEPEEGHGQSDGLPGDPADAEDGPAPKRRRRRPGSKATHYPTVWDS